MVKAASAQADRAVGVTDPETDAESTPPGPPGGEAPADAAEPPEDRASLWRRLRRSRLGVAAMLPALLLAAAFVATPFAGTATHAVDQPTVTSAPAYPGSGR